MKTIQTSIEDGVAQIRFDRADKANALDATMWRELREGANKPPVNNGHG